ncbi:ABC transporter permease [Jonesia quinghaiensis]|uniref:ABC transporter permease n=1 Tax=Jonesia quinghaiensis TaxID=262806 RepID=UPI0004299026|nr:ABC transporter permease subunit [Jonesia quinghaiensis]
MEDFRIPVGERASEGVDWVVENLGSLFDWLRSVFVGMYESVNWVLSTPPAIVVIITIVVLGLFARGWTFAVASALGLLLIVGMDQWDNAMNTLALVLVAATIAIVLAIPLGIAAAKVRPVSIVVRPVMDFLQTMPAFVYLIPALLLFRVGVAPGIVATIIFAMAPGVRLTELGIRGVDRETVEAGQAFGATPGRILRQIQLPLALPSIMAGINQVIMLSLSMVVIAGLVGAGGLGGDVITSLNRLDTALGVEAGLSVVILAMLLDRFTSAFGERRGLYAALRKGRPAVGNV